MSKKKKKHTKPELSINQQQALAYVRYLHSKDKNLKALPPDCPCCEKSFANFEDAFEILQANMCGFCQAWENVPPEIKEQVSAINLIQPSFNSVLKRLIPFRPNVARLLPSPL